MRTIASALAAALLIASYASPASTQTAAPTDKGKDAAKVYAYKQAAPAATASQAPAAASSPTGQGTRAGEHDPKLQTFGSPRWWEEMQRTIGGDGGG